MELSDAIGQAKRGNALLFTGAGFSFGAKNLLRSPDDNVPDARAFAKRLAQQLGSHAEYPLQIVSQSFLKKEGENGLVRELLNNFQITHVEDYHKTIAQIPWLRVYTTNYDNCFEFSAVQTKNTWTPLTVEAKITSQKHICLHINGHIANLNVTTLAGQLKLTHTSYSADSFANSHWSQQLRQDANAAKAIVFIGYSMSDLDIARVFFSSPELTERTIFIVSPFDDEIVVSPLENYGSVYRIGIEKFAEKITETVVTVDSTPHQYTWLKLYDVKPRDTIPDDISGIQLITKGAIDSSCVAWALGQPDPIYCVRRAEIALITDQIKKGRHWFLLHADLGNGKTLLKEQLSFLLTQSRYRVYWDSDFDIHKQADLRALARETGKIALFLDETSERFEAIDGILQLNLPHLIVFVCARTTLYELGEAKYDEYLPDSYIPINLNRLSAQNARKFVTLFNRLGLWGERARLSDDDKLNFISTDCGGAVSRLIVSTFEDSEVGKRIRHAANSLLNDRSPVATVVIGSFLVSRIGLTPNPDLLGDMMNQDVWNLMKSEPFKQAGEFIRFESGGVVIRSSIISQYLLRNAINPENLIWHIERFIRRLAVVKRSHTLHRIFTELQRFPLLESIVSSGNQRDRKRQKEIVIGYYQSIKDLPYCERNALFWLHYAMARLEFNEFEVATLYFNQAREFARGREGETRDVNNHFARLLLDSRIRGENYDDYFKAFQAAHSILVEQMNKNTNRHYPYRQAKKYVEYIAHRKQQFTPGELETFRSSCRQVKSAIKNIRGNLGGAPEVKQCDEYMDRAIEIATLDT